MVITRQGESEPRMRRRTLLGGLVAPMTGCVGDISIYQPTPELPEFDRYQSDKNIKININAVKFDATTCRLRVSGTVTDIQWPTDDLRLSLYVFDENGSNLTTVDTVFQRVAPGEVVEFEFDTMLSDCADVAAYEVVGRRI